MREYTIGTREYKNLKLAATVANMLTHEVEYRVENWSYSGTVLAIRKGTEFTAVADDKVEEIANAKTPEEVVALVRELLK